MVYQVIDVIFGIMDMLILARVLLSLFGLDPYHPVVRFIYETTEPILAPIRRIMPNTGMLDFSPLVAWFLLDIVKKLVIIMLNNIL